jgi:hypothetical protein
MELLVTDYKLDDQESISDYKLDDQESICSSSTNVSVHNYAKVDMGLSQPVVSGGSLLGDKAAGA